MSAGEGLKPRPKRRYNGKVQWVVNLDTGRFGDWVIVETAADATEDDVRKTLTRTQRKKATSIRRVYRAA